MTGFIKYRKKNKVYINIMIFAFSQLSRINY